MKNSQVHVLVVDDDQELLESIANLFKSLGFYVQTATNGKAALEIIKKNKVNVVLSDIRMQDGDGWYLAKMMKALPDHPRILFITGFSEQTVEQVFHEGIDGFFEKPFNASAVKNAVMRTCSRQQDRWQMMPTRQVDAQISLRANSLSDLAKSDQVHFGRGGFCFNHENMHLSEGAYVEFEITNIGGQPFSKLKGIGTIVWRHLTPNSKVVGYGLEIDHLEQDGPDIYVKNFGKEFSWIPSMNLISLPKVSSG